MNRLLALAFVVLVVFSVAAVACAPAAAPTPAPAASKAPDASKPASEPTKASSPAATTPQDAAKPTAAAKPAAKTDWQAEWDKTVAAARKEGKVVVAGGQGDLYRNAAMAFQKAFPDIQLEYTGVQGSAFAPKVLAERDADQYLWDVLIGGATSVLEIYIPRGAMDPLRPTLVLPEVLDDNSWIGGFEDVWMDNGRQYILGFGGTANPISYVNRDVVPESELNSIDQLVDPKWKGKIVMGDPRAAGTANGQLGYLLKLKGEDWVRKLFAQDLVVMKDERPMVESLVRGQYPIMFGVNPAPIVQFKQEGLGLNVLPLAPNNPASVVLSTGSGNLMIFNKAPHPNAAKVYVNWLLSAEGMKAWVAATNLNTRRVGAEGPGDYAPKPNIKYTDLNKEEFVPIKLRVGEIAKEMIK